jgi:phage tail sheath protein FI
MIANFLTNIWKEGALQGAKATDAFSVAIGLGTTMTAQDILDGVMKISVKIAITHPGEFIVITFQQEMAKS